MRNLSSRMLIATAMISLLTLAGCDWLDPLKRPYEWNAENVNPRNIAAMVVNPADLTHGRDAPRRKVVTESDPVLHMWEGKPTPLLSSSALGSTGSGSSGGSGGGGAPATGGGS
jgi:uncharacterized membrane protein YgcG